MRWLLWLLVVLFVLLQYKLWVGDGSLAEVWDLYRQTELQKQENQRLQELSLIHISEPTRPVGISRMPSSA